MQILVGNKSSVAIQLDTGTVQGAALSLLLFNLFINALLRLIDSIVISFQVRGIPDWNHQAFAYNLSLYVSSIEDANTLINIVSAFQEWSGHSTPKEILCGHPARYRHGPGLGPISSSIRPLY